MSFQSLLSAMAVSLGVRQKVADPRTFASDDQVRCFDEEHALRLDSPRHIAGLDLMTHFGIHLLDHTHINAHHHH